VPLHSGLQTATVRLTEGELKADVATVLSQTLTISAPGATTWRATLPVLQRFGPRKVFVAFDADWRSNVVVRRALTDGVQALRAAGFLVLVETWDAADGKGIDDVLVAGHQPRSLPAFVEHERRAATGAQKGCSRRKSYPPIPDTHWLGPRHTWCGIPWPPRQVAP
jgi:hypothetical protein